MLSDQAVDAVFAPAAPRRKEGCRALTPAQKAMLLRRIDRAFADGSLQPHHPTMAAMLRALFPEDYSTGPAAATDAQPGTPRKLGVLEARAEKRRDLFHPDDPTVDDQRPGLDRLARALVAAPTGQAARVGDVVRETAAGAIVVEAVPEPARLVEERADYARSGRRWERAAGGRKRTA